MGPLSLIYKKKIGVLLQTWNPSHWRGEARGSQVQGLPRLQGEFKANMGNLVRSCVK